MGRRKIELKPLPDRRVQQVTFSKRKFGLMKKAFELSTMCDCQVALIFFSKNNKVYQFSSSNMEQILFQYTQFQRPHESKTNADMAASHHSTKRDAESALLQHPANPQQQRQ